MPEAEPAEPAPSGPGKKNIRFGVHMDVILLREVMAKWPFGKTALWADICEVFNQAMNTNIDARRARERTQLLLDHFKREDLASLKR